MSEVTLADIEAARDLLAGVAIRTPMEDSRWLSSLVGGPALLKCENLQRTGSFKARGAYTRISRLSPEERARGVVAASAGNHAQGVALAAQLLGIRATVFMPEGAPIPKERATRGYGAEVVFHGRYLEDCPGGGPGVRGGDRSDADPSVRPRRHRGRAGHHRAGDHGAGARGPQDRAGADRRRRAARRHRDRGQVAAPRRPGGRRPGQGRGRLPRVAAAGLSGAARAA